MRELIRRSVLIILLLLLPANTFAWHERLSPEDTAIIAGQSKVFAEILSFYATESLVKPDNLLACSQEMLRMKPNENSCRDRHSFWRPREDNADFQIELSGVFGGVGLEIAMQDGKVVVVSPLDGTPAYQAGFRPGDEILEVDGVPVTNSTDAVKRIRGQVGTSVKITIQRGGERKTYELVRAQIRIRVVEAKTLDGGIGYVKTKMFNALTAPQFREAMNKFLEENKPVVLDFRGNPGGLLISVLDMLWDFAGSQDTFIIFRERTGETRYDTLYVSGFLESVGLPRDGPAGKFRNMKLAILINKGSASASEIFAGTMKDWGFQVVGSDSFGKGVGQTEFLLSDGSVLHLTTFEFLVGNAKTKIADTGVKPTHQVNDPEPSSAEILREDKQLKKAIEILSK